MSAAAGYSSRAYADSLSEFGQIIELPRCGGFLLKQPVGGSGRYDGMGPYPLFSCRDWSGLSDDLQSLADELVCVYMVADPFAETSVDQLQDAFPDLCYAYKEHFAVDLSQPVESIVDSHHRRNIRKGLRNFEIRQLAPDEATLKAWQSLYGRLIERHRIEGIARFSRPSFACQFAVPGFAAFAALSDGEICGMTLWYVDRGVAYYHLGAYNDRGYAGAASFAIFATALPMLAAGGARWAALGASAGVEAADSGLTRFKRGWSTETRPAYLCGRILQSDAYRELAAAAPVETKFFPAYRALR